MESEEVDAALEELESRLERLRALYEQYFLGIEKLEPQIPRKDVDRRIYVLRREKIRNTGKRFKLQTLISRYNTFQQYWQRVCRDIENGTYKRHVLRAEKALGPTSLLTGAARRRFGKGQALRDSQQPQADSTPSAPATTSTAQHAEPIGDSPPTTSATASTAQHTEPIGDSPPTTSATSPPAPASVRPGARASAWPGLPPPRAQGSAPPPAAAARRPSSVPAKPTPPNSPPPQQQPFESLELDMGFMGDWDPQTAAMGRSAIGARPQAARPLRNALEGQRGARERAAARPVETPSARRPQPQKPQPQPQPPKPPKPAAGPVAADPARVAVRERTVRHEPVSDSSLRELHQRLAEISKTAGRPTVSFEGLAKSLRATEAKLREKHGNRPIEFEIALKDGKPVVKPIVR